MKSFLLIAAVVTFAACNANSRADSSAVASDSDTKSSYTCDYQIFLGPKFTPSKSNGSFDLSSDKDFASKNVVIESGDNYMLSLDRSAKPSNGIAPLSLLVMEGKSTNNSRAMAEDGSKVLFGGINLGKTTGENDVQIAVTCLKK